MIGSLPRCWLILCWSQLTPDLCVPVQNIDWIKSLLVGSSSSEDNYLICLRIITKRAIGAMRGTFARCGYFGPFALRCVIGPKIIHIVRVLIRGIIPAYPPNMRISSPTIQHECPQRGQGLLLLASIFFQVGFSMSLKIEFIDYNLLLNSK